MEILDFWAKINEKVQHYCHELIILKNDGQND